MKRDGQIVPKPAQKLRQDRRRRNRSPLGHRRKVIEQSAWPRRVVAQRKFAATPTPVRPAGEAVSTRPFKPDQRIVIRDLESHVCRSAIVNRSSAAASARSGSSGLRGEHAAREHVQAGERQAFRTADPAPVTGSR